MKRTLPLTALATGALLLSTATGQPPGATGQDKKSASESKEAEVRFINGSIVYVTILQVPIEVQTPFGKLTIPPRDIRSIEFGVHLPEGVEAKIDGAVHLLASSQYRQRDTAVRDLVALGPYAWPALHRAAKSKEPEVASRAQAALKQIERKVPARQLRLKEEDLIRTSKFTVIGKIVTPTIKAKAEYFGELELRPHQMLSIRWLEGAGETEVVVDAARYGSAHNQWMDAGVHVDAQLDLLITATGAVDLWPQGPGQYMAGPNGMAGARPQPQAAAAGIVAANPGVLVGRIGEDGQPFVLGDRYSGRPARTGKLYLHIGPSPWNNASTGAYRVRIVSGAGVAETGR